MTTLELGQAVTRVEDRRFLTGGGRYLDDIVLESMVHAVVLRSPHAHAHIHGIDTGAAAAMPGVQAVLTGKDVAAAGIGPMEPYEVTSEITGEPFSYPTHHLLAQDRVRYVGDPVALVLAESLDQARDAAESIMVDYEPLPVVTTAAAAVVDGAVRLSDEAPGNICLHWNAGDEAGAAAGIAQAAHVVRLDVNNHRLVANSLDPRGAIGLFDADSGRYTLYLSQQSIHIARDHIARTLGIAPSNLRLIAPDVGGGFGTKNFAYGEHVLMLWAARIVGRPVKWINGRSDSFLSDHTARDHRARAELALSADGTFQALRVTSWANLGAYLVGSIGRVQTGHFTNLAGGVYRIPAIHLAIGAAFTNTVPLGVMRGPGHAEHVNIMERLIDTAARQIGMDRAELRRRNMVTSEAMPHTTYFGTTIDSGDFQRNLDLGLERADADGFAERRRDGEGRGKLRGFGFACFMKATGGAPEENVAIRFSDDGFATLITGTQSIGQGHETSFPQIVSSLLGIPFERIRYYQGDTDLIAKGGGHGSSRATYMGGSAIFLAAEKIIAKGRAVAAQALEAGEDDVEFAGGRFTVVGTDRGLDILEVARLARQSDLNADGEAGLDTAQDYTRANFTFPNGCHVAEVEIDPDTGQVTLARYTAVDDYGVIINPMLAMGQVHGAAAQGIGQALMEQAVYDDESGQLLAGSFMDYGLPRADDVPMFDPQFNGIACTTNPLGVKGCGESGAIAGFPAVINAVVDALAPFGVRELDGPATPERIWRLLNAR